MTRRGLSQMSLLEQVASGGPSDVPAGASTGTERPMVVTDPPGMAPNALAERDIGSS